MGIRTILSLFLATAILGCNAPSERTRIEPESDAKEGGEAASVTEMKTDTKPAEPEPVQLNTVVPQKNRIYQDPTDVLVSGDFTVDVMQLATSERAMILGQKLQAAMQSDPEWALSHTQESKPGEPLPYDRRMGLTEAEYQEFLERINDFYVKKTREGRLEITQIDKGRFILNGVKELPDFKGITIDLDRNQVTTPYGTLNKVKSIDASGKSALGAWRGTEWRFEDVDLTNARGTIAKLAVGKLAESGRCVIMYDVKALTQSGKKEIMEILYFDNQPQ